MDKSRYGELTWEQLVSYPSLTIHSVRRLSDGEVFTVGEVIESLMSHKTWAISSFTICGKWLFVGSAECSNESKLDYLKKLPPQPIQKERIWVTGIEEYEERYPVIPGTWYQFRVTQSIPEEKFPVIKRVIEYVLNQDNKTFEEFLINGYDRQYTEQQLNEEREKVWKAARKLDSPDYHHTPFSFSTFQDYQNSKTKNSISK